MPERDSLKVLVLDVETTGTRPATSEIVEIALGDGLGDDASIRTFRVRPSRPIPPEASEIHGIGDDDVAGAEPFAAIAPLVLAAISEADVLAGYNVRFDLGMLDAELERAALPPLDLSGTLVVDPFVLWRKMEPRTLAGAHARFVGSPLAGAHRAGADVAATGRVLEAMIGAFDLEDASWEDLAKICEVQRPGREHPVVLFDGVCTLCAGWVKFVLARDAKGRFRFASLQSDVAARLLASSPRARGVDSIVLVERGVAHVKSTAALRILRGLGGVWRAAYVFVIVPRPIRDAVYDVVARNRYRWFGRTDTCFVPTPEIRRRFLDVPS